MTNTHKDPSLLPPLPANFTFAAFIASDSTYSLQRQRVWNRLDWTPPPPPPPTDQHSTSSKHSWNAKVALATKNLHRLGTASSLTNANGAASLSLSSKRVKKPGGQRESQQYLLHKLGLFVRDSFKEKALGTIKALTKDTLKANAACTRRIFLECLVMASAALGSNSQSSSEMEQVAVALLERGSFGLFDVPIFGASTAFFPSFFVVAVALGRLAVVQKFLTWKKRSILTQCTWQGIPVLFFGCFSKQLKHVNVGSASEMVKVLLDNNADAALPCCLGDLERLALGKAAENASCPAERRFFARPLYSFEVAAFLHDLPTVQLLINRIQRCNLIGNAHFCFLLQTNTPISIWLLKAGASASHQRTRTGKTPLHVAVQASNFELVAIYLRVCGAASLLEARDCEGNTALHLAALHKERRLFLYLASKGANAQARNCEGQSAMEIAQCQEIAESMQSQPQQQQIADLEASAYELYDNSGAYLPKERGRFPFNERLYRSIVSSFSSSSKTCPSSGGVAGREDSSGGNSPSTEETRSSRRCSTKFSLLNSLTSMFRKQ